MLKPSSWKGAIANVVCCAVLLGASGASGQTPESLDNLEQLHVIHTPTAGVLKKGQYQVDFRAYGENGANAGVGIGLFDRFMFGVSFGGVRLLGYDEPGWNKLPGMIVKYRVIEENQYLPAITAGYDMQGRGAWFKNRYLYKAPGAFAAVSRNFIGPLGRFGVHGGLNYNSIETEDDRGMDAFAGLDFSLNEQLVLLVEYDFALDDNLEDGSFGEKKWGYLNAGARFTFARSLIIELDITDLLNTSAETPGIGRELKIIYVETF